MDKQFLTRREFSVAYAVGLTKTHELINMGEIVALKMGRKTLISSKSAEEWASRLPRSKSKMK